QSEASDKKHPTRNTTEKNYTSEQVQAVKAVLACGTDYYKVLNLDKGCNETQLALQFHPDKNNAPGADEAFKLISKAFTVLSDPQKKAIHDAGGGDPEQRASASPSGFSSGFGNARGFGEDISPEDLFNMFFGGNMSGFAGPGFSSATFVGPGFRTQAYHTGGQGFQARHHFGQQRQQRAGQQQQGYSWTVLLQMLPLLILFGYSILSGLFTDNTPVFSFKPNSVYSENRKTMAHSVPYYVNPSTFKVKVKDNYRLSRIEQQIEVDWVHGLQHDCRIQRQTRAARLNAASGVFGIGRNEEKYQEALRYPMKSCEEIKRFG
ncbi:hypothetical protein BDF14DRAFT_1692592, partial [Spinellus fusiger]